MIKSTAYRGFTLIELLVVIAIIAVLASILFPVFMKARGKAWQSKCAAHMRQIAAAVSMYVQDNDETYPPLPTDKAWSAVLAQYGEGAVYDCPAKTGTGSLGRPEFGFNRYLMGYTNASVNQPVNALMLADFKMTRANTDPTYTLADFNQDIDVTRHGNGANFVCADGHVTFESFSLTDPQVMATLVARGYDLFPAGKPITGMFSDIVLTNPDNDWARSTPITIPAMAVRAGTATPPSVKIEFTVNNATWSEYDSFGVTMYEPGAAFTPPGTWNPVSPAAVLPTTNSVCTASTGKSNLGAAPDVAPVWLYAASATPDAKVTYPTQPASAKYKYTIVLLKGAKMYVTVWDTMRWGTAWTVEKDFAAVMNNNKLALYRGSNTGSSTTLSGLKFFVLR